MSESKVEGLDDFFSGPTAVIWAKEDPISPAKILTKFAKDAEGFSVKGGLFDGEVLDPSRVKDLASMPSKEEIQAKLLSLLNAPATQLLRLLNAPGTKLAGLLEAWRGELEKKGE